MKTSVLPAIGLGFAALALSVPAAATEVEVTRFHTPASLGQAAPGPIAVRAGAGLPGDSLETQVWLDSVAAALTREGFTVVADAPRVAEVNLEQALVPSARRGSGSGVSVGVGVGSGGGWGGGYGRRSGIDLGIGLGMIFGGNKSREALDSRLAVTIRDSAGAPLWEGRAEAAPGARSKDAQTRRLADEMAAALFSGFPGESGATIAGR